MTLLHSVSSQHLLPAPYPLRRKMGHVAARSAVLLACMAPGACTSSATPPPRPVPSAPKTPAPAASSEPMPAEHVLFSLRGKEDQARSCFALSDPPVRGNVRLRWDISTSGAVQQAAVEQAALSEHDAVPRVSDCLTRFVSQLHFETQPSPMQAQWTFVSGLGDPAILVQAEKRAKRQRGKKGFDKPKGKRARGRNRGPALDADSRGRLATAHIESVAEAGFRLYAHCLREGVVRNTYLSGRVLLHLHIDTSGQVRSVTDAGSDLPDLQAIDCVAQGFYAMRFAAPSGGPVGVTYPILLNEE